jgi:purine-cytosine permease-like protein
MAAGILAIGGGTLAGTLLLVGLLVGETDEAFADVYSGAISMQNIFPRIPRRALIVSIAVVAGILADFLTMGSYETFLFLLGSVFVPLFGVLAADYYFRGRRVRGEPSSSSWQPVAFAGWIAGFITYHWITPTGPAWWVEAFTRALGMPLSVRLPWLTASVPAFLIAFLVGLVTARWQTRSR